MIIPWKERKDFDIHLKYVSLIARLSRGATVSCDLKATIDKTKLQPLGDKIRLIKMTRQSIKDEWKIIELDAEFSTAAVLWLPIKSYYLSYHLLCVIDYILTGNIRALRAGHGECLERFTAMLADGSLRFSEPLLNQVFDKSILSFKTKSGDVLRSNISDGDLYRLAMKKIALEKIEYFKRREGISDVRSERNWGKVERFKNENLKVSVFDFFYQMRLRLNYRDFSFIDNVTAKQTKTYFEQYYTATGNIYTCFANLGNRLIANAAGFVF